MRYSIASAIAMAVLATASDVHDLKKDTFESFIADNNLVLAEFFAPWCGHCKALAPEYEEAATTLKEKNIPLAKIDCTEEADLCSKYGVEGYPTLKVFRGPDAISSYSGARKAPAIISYMTKQSLPAVSVLDKSTLDDFKTADKVVLVAYFAADDKASNETFNSVANTLRDDYLFGATSDEALAKAEGIKQPSIVLYKSFDEGKNTFSEKFEKEAIEKFTKTAATPLIGEVGPETYSGYMAAGLPLAYIFAETPEERETLAKELKPIAEKHKGKINFATIDAKSFGQHGGNLNLEVGKWPAFAIQETVKNQKFPYDQTKKINVKDIGSFVEEFVSGKMEPSIKSEAVPEKQDGPVTIVVAKNYDEVVLDDDKDVLIEFYAPWCGHCKALAPKYDDLGSMFKSFSSKVTIAKVDATLNDVPDEIQGFPTIKLYPAGKKDEPITYSGGRTAEDLAEFIKENGTHKVAANGDAKAAPAASEVKDKAESATEGVKDKAESATDGAKDKAATATEGVKDKVKSAVSGAAEAVKTVVSDEGEVHDEL
ncbi:prolyl 4-hydroxylase, beta polypeptide [Tothia fuscella]|uniref:Protein disulfide-isomerase n=1 Tax=Tothia fuscella TaxID=1048955 RepID=A0A9P4TWK4_9PEZI|nr:prolyl 4-hydroxylase, beta polypeptide [Tothia fuscella]